MEVYCDTVRGKREANEDAHKIICNIHKKNKNVKDINYFSLFDGHGGKEVSKFLSQKMHHLFFDKRISYPLNHKNVYKIYDHIDKMLSEEYYAQYAGSTALVVMHYKDKTGKQFLNIINLGDCRAVICRDNFAFPLTKDHKPNHPEERRRIKNLGGDILFDGRDYRINGLSVSRSFGDYDCRPYVTHIPELFCQALSSKDKFIVLACDGLWDVLSNTDVVNFVISSCYDQNIQKLKKCPNVAKQLTELALKKGSTDNVSVIVIFF